MTSKTPAATDCLIVLYRWRLHAGAEDAFVQGWSRITELLRLRGSLGSRLHRGSDGLWYSYAQWPSAEVRRDIFALGSLDEEASHRMKAAKTEAESTKLWAQADHAVMDAAAFSLCKENEIPIIVLNLDTAGQIERAVRGDRVGTLVHN